MTQEFVTLRREVVEQALNWIATRPEDRPISAGRMVAILVAALEQPQGEQEPVATVSIAIDGSRTTIDTEWNDRLAELPAGTHHLYTRQHPKREPQFDAISAEQQREPLTIEQIAAATGAKPGTPMWLVAVAFTSAIEATHGIK